MSPSQPSATDRAFFRWLKGFNATTYAIRFLDQQEKLALSLFLQWGKSGEYEPGQVEAWQALRDRYGEMWQPALLKRYSFCTLQAQT